MCVLRGAGRSSHPRLVVCPSSIVRRDFFSGKFLQVVTVRVCNSVAVLHSSTPDLPPAAVSACRGTDCLWGEGEGAGRLWEGLMYMAICVVGAGQVASVASVFVE